LRVGDWVKQFDVVGAREWRVLGPAVTATRPLPFRRMPFSYDTAFGGVDALDPDDDLPAVYEDNPVGTGFAAVRNQSRLSGLAAAQHRGGGAGGAVALRQVPPHGARPDVGRGWPERRRYAGTYDGVDRQRLSLPARRTSTSATIQMAPADQQIPFPAPGTPVVVVGLTPRGREAFRLPDTALPLTRLPRAGGRLGRCGAARHSRIRYGSAAVHADLAYIGRP
jgi:hypothetical protein